MVLVSCKSEICQNNKNISHTSRQRSDHSFTARDHLSPPSPLSLLSLSNPRIFSPFLRISKIISARARGLSWEARFRQLPSRQIHELSAHPSHINRWLKSFLQKCKNCCPNCTAKLCGGFFGHGVIATEAINVPMTVGSSAARQRPHPPHNCIQDRALQFWHRKTSIFAKFREGSFTLYRYIWIEVCKQRLSTQNKNIHFQQHEGLVIKSVLINS